MVGGGLQQRLQRLQPGETVGSHVLVFPLPAPAPRYVARPAECARVICRVTWPLVWPADPGWRDWRESPLQRLTECNAFHRDGKG